MAIEEPQSRIDNFTNYYETIVAKMVGVESTQYKSFEAIRDIFQDLEISSEAKGQALTEIAVQTSVQFNKDATNAAIELIKLEPEFELKAIQRDLVARQIQGYDDNLLVKIVEQQGELASFAVNAGSDSAQTTINDLKTKMSNLEARVSPIGDDVIETTPITAVPTSLVSGLVTNTSITITWGAVLGATSYLVYKDGVLVSTSGSISYTASNLDANTKYAFTVKASINGIVSDHTNAIVIKTTNV